MIRKRVRTKTPTKKADTPKRMSASLVAGAGFEPATFGLCLPLRLSPLILRIGSFVVWTFSSPSAEPLGACRQVSTPSQLRAWLGITTQQASPNLTEIHAPVSIRAQPKNYLRQ